MRAQGRTPSPKAWSSSRVRPSCSQLDLQALSAQCADPAWCADSEVQDVIKPSGPFCAAVDGEDEFDASDATAVLVGLPARHEEQVGSAQAGP